MKDVLIEELSAQEDHHLDCSVPPKVSVSAYMVFLKGKLAIKVFRSYPKLKQRLYWGNHFWSHGYFVSTVCLDEDLIRRYIRYNDNNDRDQELRDSYQNTLF